MLESSKASSGPQIPKKMKKRAYASIISPPTRVAIGDRGSATSIIMISSPEL